MSLAETKSDDFVISRVFDAPRELVWKCFTDPEHMKQWWGPKGFTVIASKMDLRPGGTYPLRHEGAGRHARCGARSSIARSRRASGSSSSTRSRTRPAAPRVIRWRRPGRWRCSRSSRSRSARRQDQVHDPLVASQCDRGGTQDLRRRPRQHASGLERNARQARKLSAEGKVGTTREPAALRGRPPATTPSEATSYAAQALFPSASVVLPQGADRAL